MTQPQTAILPLYFKTFVRYLRFLCLGCIALLLLYLAAAFCLSRIGVDKEHGHTEDITIYIKTNGVHTDLVVPVKNDVYDWTKSILFSHTHLKDTTHISLLAMGWGDRGFYLETPAWKDLKLRTAFKAAFALSSTAMHTSFYRSVAENASCKKILISTAQYKRLVAFIRGSFKYDRTGQITPIITNANYSDADAFYEATGRYSLLKTCNSWVNEALKYCGQKACLWTAFDTGIFLRY